MCQEQYLLLVVQVQPEQDLHQVQWPDAGQAEKLVAL